MRILHTSDWHLGKKLFKHSRIEEQIYFLNWLQQVIKNEEVDVLIIAGDIFDSSTPPNIAMKIYFDFLDEITKTSSLHVLIIGGNHDSGRLLESPAQILKSRNIIIKGHLSPNIEENIFSITKNNISYSFLMLPYFRAIDLFPYQTFENASPIETLENIFKQFNALSHTSKNILIAHHLFGSYQSSGSEYGLSLSGVDSIPTKILSVFEYCALGHIHKTQKISQSPNCIYPGSPIAFRFSETTQKHISIIDLEDIPNIRMQTVPQLFELKSINCSTEELPALLHDLCSRQSSQSTLIEFKIAITTPQTGIADLIREKLKDQPYIILTIQLDYQNFQDDDLTTTNTDLSLQEIFKEFYLKKFPDSTAIDQDIMTEFLHLIETESSEQTCEN